MGDFIFSAVPLAILLALFVSVYAMVFVFRKLKTEED